MHHSNLGDLRQRMVAITTEAKKNGHKIEDIVPEEMLDRFQNLNALKNAKDYIKEVEDREKHLQEENESLKKRLAIAEKVAEDILEDRKQFQIDSEQQSRQVEFLRELQQGAEANVSLYKSKYLELLKVQASSDEKDLKIKELEKECQRYQSVISKLTKESHSTAKVIDTIREQKEHALEKKETRIMELEKSLKDLEAYSKSVEDESERFEALYQDLMQRLEAENRDCAATINKEAEKMHKLAKERCAAVSEAVILRRFYEHCVDVLQDYQKIFRQLLNDKQQVIELPDSLEFSLDSTRREYEALFQIHTAFENEGIEMCAVRKELEGIAVAAILMQDKLHAIADDAADFLMVREEKPALWETMRMKIPWKRKTEHGNLSR